MCLHFCIRLYIETQIQKIYILLLLQKPCNSKIAALQETENLLNFQWKSERKLLFQIILEHFYWLPCLEILTNRAKQHKWTYKVLIDSIGLYKHIYTYMCICSILTFTFTPHNIFITV